MFKLASFTDEISQDFQRAVDVCLAYELDGIEIRSVWDTPPEKLTDEQVSRMKEILADTGLSVCSIASPFYKCDIDSPEEIAQHHEILRRCAALGRAFGCTIVRGFTFWRKGNRREQWTRILDNFETPIKIAREEGVTLCIENESSTMIGTGATLRRFLDEINEDCIRAVWDPANAIHDPEETETPFPDGYEAIRPYMVHMHMKDAARVSDTGKLECVPVGVGEVNYRQHFQRLHDDSYEGYVSLETHWRPKPLTKEQRQRPGGSAYSESAEYASKVCLDNIKSMYRQVKRSD